MDCGLGRDYIFSFDEIQEKISFLQRDIMFKLNLVSIISKEISSTKAKYLNNLEKIKGAQKLPYLISNVNEILNFGVNEDGNSSANENNLDKFVVIKTSMNEPHLLTSPGLVEADALKPEDIVGVNRDSYNILKKIPKDFSSISKFISLCPDFHEHFSDIGGLERQIRELKEAVILPILEKKRFENLGISCPSGVLLYGPPGNGKTLLARACASESQMSFISITGSKLIQPHIGDGAKLVQELFELAKSNSPSIILIDEIDAVGSKRLDSSRSVEKEVQRTMLELLFQLDNINQRSDIKVIAASSRVDLLDPALIRSGRLEKKIEVPNPTKDERTQIMKIHTRKMNLANDINLWALADLTDGFSGSECKAACVEAAMNALKQSRTCVGQQDFQDAIYYVKGKSQAISYSYA